MLPSHIFTPHPPVSGRSKYLKGRLKRFPFKQVNAKFHGFAFQNKSMSKENIMLQLRSRRMAVGKTKVDVPISKWKGRVYFSISEPASPQKFPTMYKHLACQFQNNHVLQHSRKSGSITLKLQSFACSGYQWLMAFRKSSCSAELFSSWEALDHLLSFRLIPQSPGIIHDP